MAGVADTVDEVQTAMFEHSDPATFVRRALFVLRKVCAFLGPKRSLKDTIARSGARTRQNVGGTLWYILYWKLSWKCRPHFAACGPSVHFCMVTETQQLCSGNSGPTALLPGAGEVRHGLSAGPTLRRLRQPETKVCGATYQPFILWKTGLSFFPWFVAFERLDLCMYAQGIFEP
jgi:hypothetical protein